MEENPNKKRMHYAVSFDHFLPYPSSDFSMTVFSFKFFSLRLLILGDWYKLKLNSTKDPYIKSLLYGICILMHHQPDNECVARWFSPNSLRNT
jgi:hypothetical protein